MKTLLSLLLSVCVATLVNAVAPSPPSPADAATAGHIDIAVDAATGNTAAFKAKLTLDVKEPGKILLIGNQPLSAGINECTVRGISDSFWSKTPEAKLEVIGDNLILDVTAPGNFELTLDLLLPVKTDGAKRQISFEFVPALKGKAQLSLADNAINIELKNAIRADAAGKEWIWNGPRFDLSWDLSLSNINQAVVDCKMTSAAQVSHTTVKICTLAAFKINRGSLSQMEFTVPAENHLSSVKTRDGKEVLWQFDAATHRLTVNAKDKFADTFELLITTERTLSQLPGSFALELVTPAGLTPASSEIVVGSKNGIKLELVRQNNLVQSAESAELRKFYRDFWGEAAQLNFYSNSSDFSAEFAVNLIKPDFSAESITQLKLEDNRLQLRFDAKMEIREAPLTEIVILFDRKLNFSRVISDRIRPQDYTVTPVSDRQNQLKLTLPPDTIGVLDFSLLFEAEQKSDAKLELSGIEIADIRNLRGNLLVVTEKGIRLDKLNTAGLTPIHSSNLTIKVNNLNLSFLYRNAPWQLSCQMQLLPRNIGGEVFSLITIGENNISGLTLFNWHLTGAPANKFVFQLSKQYENVEFSGLPITGSKKIAGSPDDPYDRYEIEFRNKLSGPAALLISYEIIRKDKTAVDAGVIHCLNSSPETVFVAVSGPKSVRTYAVKTGDRQQAIAIDQLPPEYAALIGNPVSLLFRSDASGEICRVEISPLDKVKTDPAVIPNADINATLDRNGNAVFHAFLNVSNVSAQFLPVTLPAGSNLWQIKVNGVIERSGVSADGKLLIPLPRTLTPQETVPIELTYAMNFTDLSKTSRLDFPLLQFDAPVLTRSFTITAPKGIGIRSLDKPPQPESAPSIARYVLWGNGVILLLIGMLLVKAVAEGRKKLKYVTVALLSLLSLAGAAVAVALALWQPEISGNTVILTGSMELPPGGQSVRLDIIHADGWLHGIKTLGGQLAALGIPVLLPLALIVFAVKKVKASVICMLALMCMTAAAGEVKNYRFAVDVKGDQSIISGTVDFKLDKGYGIKIGNNQLLLNDFTLPPGAELIRNRDGEWFLYAAQDDIEGAARFAGVSGIKDRALKLYLPQSLNGTTTLKLPANLKLAGDQWMTQNSGNPDEINLIFPAGTGDALLRFEEKEPTGPAQLQAALEQRIEFRRDAILLDVKAKVNIVQNPVNELTFTVPSKLKITRLTGKDINSWSHQGDQLRIFFNQRQTGEVTILWSMTEFCGKLPYQWSYRSIRLADAASDIANLELYSAPDVRAQIDYGKAFTAANKPAAKNFIQSLSGISGGEIKVTVAEIIPELQTSEQTEIRYDDEKITISSLLQLELLKGGVFTVNLKIPDHFEVMKLTGPDLAYWSESAVDKQKITLYFKQRLEGKTSISLQLAKLSEKVTQPQDVPKIGIENAAKVTGTLAILCERGNVINVLKRTGVANSDGNVNHNNAVYWRLTDPDWSMAIAIEPSPLWMQVDTTQTVKIRINSVENEIVANIKIENNPDKFLDVELPPNCLYPEFDGRFLTRANLLGKNVWRLEFSQKIDKNYRLTIRSRLGLGDNRALTLLPVRFVNASSQANLCVIQVYDNLEYKLDALSGDINQVSLSALPAQLTGQSVAAFRMLNLNWSAQVTTVSNQMADMLKIQIKNLYVVTQLAPNGVVLNKLNLEFDNRQQPFLLIKMPEKFQFWGAKVNNLAVEAVMVDGKLAIPVDNGQDQHLEFIYSTVGDPCQKLEKFTMPVFGTPLNEINWRIYAAGDSRIKLKDSNLELSADPVYLPLPYESKSVDSFVNAGRQLKNAASLRDFNRQMQNAIDLANDGALKNDLKGEMLLSNRERNRANIATRQGQLARGKGDSETAEVNNDLDAIADKIFLIQQSGHTALSQINFNFENYGDSITLRRAIEVDPQAQLYAECMLQNKPRYWGGIIAAIFLVAAICLVYQLVKITRRYR